MFCKVYEITYFWGIMRYLVFWSSIQVSYDYIIAREYYCMILFDGFDAFRRVPCSALPISVKATMLRFANPILPSDERPPASLTPFEEHSNISDSHLA
jgi:hypothetical protein